MLLRPNLLIGRAAISRAQHKVEGDNIFPAPDGTWANSPAEQTFVLSADPFSITITTTGTTASTRKSITVESGVWYRMIWRVGTANAFCGLGTSSGGHQYKGVTNSHSPGLWGFDFRTTSTTLWIQFHRTGGGTTVITEMDLRKLT